LVGLVVSSSALSGYFLMIMGPFEGGHSSLDIREVHGLLLSNVLNIAGGFVTGPLYGWLGQRWRTRRAWMSAVLVAGALCLEPFAVTAVGRSYPGESAAVWTVEVLAGIAVAAYFLVTGIAYRRRSAPEMSKPTAA
jgi:MFS family permease